MSHRDPKSLWDELMRALRGRGDDDDDRSAVDPNVVFHLLFTLPLLIGLLATARRL